MATKPKHDLNAFVPAINADSVLLTPTTSQTSTTPASLSARVSVEQPTRIRFTNTLDADVWKQLHQLAYWERKDLNLVMEAALKMYFQEHPESQRELPEDEQKRRRLS